MFEIIIKRTQVEQTIVGGRWEKIGQRLLTEKDIEDSMYHNRSALEAKVKAGEVIKMDVMGYNPEDVKKANVEREIYRQSVPELDLAAVIRAINKL